MMNEQAVSELVQLVRDGVEGAEARLTEALPVLAGEVRTLGLVYLLTAGLCFILIVGSFVLARKVAVWSDEDEAPYIVATIVSTITAIFGIVAIVHGIPMLCAPHLELLKMLT